MNDIKVKEFNMPPIEWNYEELKAELSAQLEKYRKTVYTDESIKDAKADRAELNKLYKAINDKKISIKKDYTSELTVFENQVKDLLAIVDNAKTTCESAINDFEDRRKQQRIERCREIYDEVKGDLGKYISFTTIFNDRWTLASTTEKEVRNDIEATFINAAEGLKIIERVNSPYELEAKRKFYETLSVPQALEVIDTLTHLQDLEQAANEALAEETELEDFPYTMDLRVTANGSQWAKLGAFCKANGIEVQYL